MRELSTARAELAKARAATERLEGELVARDRQEAVLRDALSAARGGERGGAGAAAQDRYVAELTNELRQADEAASAAVVERQRSNAASSATPPSSRTQGGGRVRRCRVRRRTWRAGGHRRVAAAAAAEARVQEASRAAEAARASSTALKSAYAALHRRASARLESLGAALTSFADREHTFRRDLTETASLLLQTHRALDGCGAGAQARGDRAPARPARVRAPPDAARITPLPWRVAADEGDEDTTAAARRRTRRQWAGWWPPRVAAA